MAYKHNLPSWTQDGAPLVAAGANNTYIAGKKRILRIVPAADIYVLVTNDKSIAASASTGALLKANQEYFIDMGDFDFLNASAATGSVVKLKQQGMSHY